MSTGQVRDRRRRILSWIVNLVGVFLLGLLLYLGGVKAWQQILRGDWRWILAAFCTTLVWNLLAAYRWGLLSNQVVDFPDDRPCPFRYYFTYQMIGMLTGQMLPVTVGMLGARPLALSLSRGVSLAQSGLAVLLDKMFDLILALLLVVPVALFLAGWIPLPATFGLMAGLVAVTVIVLGWKFGLAMRYAGALGLQIARIVAVVPVLGPRLSRGLARSLNRLTGTTPLPNRVAVFAFLTTLVMYSLLAVRHSFIAMAVHLDIPWYLMAMGVCVSQLTLIFSVTPGSIGFLEAGWAAVLAMAGLSPEQIALFLIARRAYLLVFTLIQLLLAFLWIRESPARLFRLVLSGSAQPTAAEGAVDQKGRASSTVK